MSRGQEGDALTFINLLGPPRRPVDGVLDHAHALSEALRGMGHKASVVHHRWDREGWLRSLWVLRSQLREADRVLMHHTHLAWSRRGFSIRALAVAALIGRGRLWVLIHDPSPFPGTTLPRKARAMTQVGVMWILVRLSGRAYMTVLPSCVPWARKTTAPRLGFLPVGSNVGFGADEDESSEVTRPFTVAVFSMTEGHRDEARNVSRAVTMAAAMLDEDIRLVAFGRGVELARPWIEQEIGSRVQLVASGVLPESEVASRMRSADVQLFVRGTASSRRGTLVAGIAHRVPIVAFAGPETCWPVTEAGIDLVPIGDIDAVARAIVRVATNRSWATRLRQKNRVAYQQYFSWERIAADLLGGGLSR